MAIVATGPMPGSTPISVPRMQPTRQYRRLVKVKATPKPSERFATRSMVSSSTRDEGDVAPDGQHRRENQHLAEVELAAGQTGDEDERIDGDDHPHRRHADARQASKQDAEGKVGADDVNHLLPGPLADRFPGPGSGP